MADALLRLYDELETVIDNDGYPWPWAHATPFGPPIKQIVRLAAGNRCVRCGHPYVGGAHGRGEWSPCDEQCVHPGPIRYRFSDGELTLPWEEHGYIAHHGWTDVPGYSPTRERLVGAEVEAKWRILTTHHLNENKLDCRWWNLAPLCQRCHLTIQGKVKMNRPYDRPHSGWFLPYVGGHYAAKYLGEELGRDEVLARIDELLALELRQDALFDKSSVA